MPELSTEQYDELMKQISILKFQQQKHQDLMEGGLTSRNFTSFRNTYVINAQDSLDATYPMYVHFNIISEMIKIVSVKVDFWIDNFRAYSKAGASGGGSTPTSSDGGAQTSSSGGAQTSSSGGDQTTSAPTTTIKVASGSNLIAHDGGYLVEGEMSAANYNHTHSQPTHTHTVASHTHTVANHTHTVTIVAHTHTAVYGIFEEDTSPTIKFYVSENEGVSYNDVFYGGYDAGKRDLEITSLLAGAGSKLIKFTSTTRARLSVQIEIKLDIRAR